MTRDTKTDTSAPGRTAEGRSLRKVPGLVVVLECDRPSAGALVVPLGRALVVGRGTERSARDGRLEIADTHLSSDHFTITREGTRFRVVDRGSRNHTFVGDEAIADGVVDDGTIIRAGHTLFACLADVGPVLERAERGAPWPFTTMHAELARDLQKLERVAQSPLPVLLLGETGTGKEVVARALHERSKRRGAFVPVNCGALPKDLVEALLFGHRRGAFSGATTDEIGFVRAADGGTLFLDEIGDLPPNAQATLLRVLQEREVTPVGTVHPVAVDLRVVAATHRPLAARVDEGSFRADLFARLRGFTLTLPPLRERRFDVGELIARLAPPVTSIKPDAAVALLRHEYPMNVRELKQALDVAAVLIDDGVIHLEDLPEPFRPAAGGEAPLADEDAALRDELARRLAASDRNVSQVAREMGKARQQIQRWMKRFRL